MTIREREHDRRPLVRRLAGQGLATGLLFLSLLALAGCGPARPKSTPVKETSSQAKREAPNDTASSLPPSFNREVHVMRTIWRELAALEGRADPQSTERRKLIQSELERRLKQVGDAPGDLTREDRAFIRKVQSHIGSNRVATTREP